LPLRKPNASYRSREHLTEREVEKLIDAAKDNRWGHRDATMVLLAFRHGLRAAELVDLRWEQVDLENAILHVRRVKQGTPATHPLTGRELRALRRLQREQGSKSPRNTATGNVRNVTRSPRGGGLLVASQPLPADQAAPLWQAALAEAAAMAHG
jgi:integrase